MLKGIEGEFRILSRGPAPRLQPQRHILLRVVKGKVEREKVSEFTT